MPVNSEDDDTSVSQRTSQVEADVEVEGELVDYVAPDPEEVLRVRFGRAMAVVFDDGSRKVHARIKDAETALTSTDAARDHISHEYALDITNDPSTLETAFDNGDLRVPVGIGVIMGPANVGKTPVLKWMVSQSNKQHPGSARLIRYGEPLPGYITRETEAVSLLVDYLLDREVKVIAIDSIKDLLGTMGGSLMARGIPREMFVMLSQWGSVAASLGKVIIVPLNISTDNADALAEVESGVLSNATFAAIASAVTGSGFKFDVTARQGEGKRRANSTMSLVFDANGVPSIINSQSGQLQSGSTSYVPGDDTATEITLSRYALGRALTRVLAKEPK